MKIGSKSTVEGADSTPTITSIGPVKQCDGCGIRYDKVAEQREAVGESLFWLVERQAQKGVRVCPPLTVTRFGREILLVTPGPPSTTSALLATLFRR